MSGQWQAAESLFLEAAERLKQCQLPAAAAHALHNLAGLHLRRGQLHEARGYYQVRIRGGITCHVKAPKGCLFATVEDVPLRVEGCTM